MQEGWEEKVKFVFESIEDKQKVMKAKAKLHVSNLYINNDLTKEQKNSYERFTKKETIFKHPDYSKKRITIFKSELWADRVQITDDKVRSADYSI